MNAKPNLVFNADLMPQNAVAVPVALLRSPILSPYAVRLYAVLLSYAAEKTEEWPGQTTLCQQVGVSERSLRNALRQLEAARLVTMRRGGDGRTAIYQIRQGGTY